MYLVAAIEVPGTDLEEIQEDAERFAALVERELKAAARRAASALDEVTITAQGGLSAASPDDLNAMTEDWRQRISVVLLPWINRSAIASIRAQIAAVNSVLGQPVIAAFDEELVTQTLLAGAENRLVGIGNELWEAARASLAEGVAAGESIPKLASRVRESAGTTAPRATTIARTEVIGASNKSSIEVLRATGLVASKRWIATFDHRVRLTHIAAHGQVVPVGSTFTVGGAELDYPGDFTGPPEEVINCRCSMGYEVDEPPTDDEVEIEALSAAAMQHDGAMIALVPTDADAERLALDGGELADVLHLTLSYLGEASNWNEDQRDALTSALASYDWDTAIKARAFGLAHWNPSGPHPCWVLNIGGDGITDALATVTLQLAQLRGEMELPDIPEPHRPFSAHVCLTYTDDTSEELIKELRARLGGITFDRVRVSFAGEHHDIQLRLHDTLLSKDAAMFQEGDVPWYIERNHEQCSDERPWAVVKEVDGSVEGCHETNEQAVQQIRELEIAEAKKREEQAASVVAAATLQDSEAPSSAKAFEGVGVVEGSWTGDGRQFAPGSLDWPDLSEVNVPLQWQKETSHGGFNDVTVNVGRLTEITRDGELVRVKGYIDTGSEDGSEVVRRMHAGTAGGVSIVADDPEQAEVEWVYPDGCPNLEEEEVTGEDLDDIELRCFMPIGMVFHSGRIRALTLVDTPAFVEAVITLVEPEETDDEQFAAIVSREFGKVNSAAGIRRLGEAVDLVNGPESVAEFIDGIEPLIAASHAILIPDVPPAEWFEEPAELPPFGALNVTDEGRIYGLLAPRGVAHRSYPNKIVKVPMGTVDYRRWMNRPTIVAGGERIRTGVITMECGHASIVNPYPEPAQDHYENSCSVVATVRIGENRHGVWVAGALVHGVTPSQVARMLACQLSGDWRKHREKPGWREFVAALLVPVPGFPVEARQQLRLDHGALVSSAVPVTWQLSGDVPRSKSPQPKRVLQSKTAIVAAVVGDTDLPIADRELAWDGAGARQRVFEMCTSGDTVDVDCVSRAFLWRNPDANPETMGAYSLGYADVIDGRLQIVPRGVAATAGGRGVDAADIPAEDKDRIKSRICTLYDRIRDQFEDWPDCPFAEAGGAASVQIEPASSLLDLPTWEDIQRKQSLREQTKEIAARLASELGIEIGV